MRPSMISFHNHARFTNHLNSIVSPKGALDSPRLYLQTWCCHWGRPGWPGRLQEKQGDGHHVQLLYTTVLYLL